MYIIAALPLTTIKTESTMKITRKDAVSYRNANFVTPQLVCLWHLVLLQQQECSQLQIEEKKKQKQSATC